MPDIRRLPLLLAVPTLLVAACASAGTAPGSSSSPPGSPSPSAVPGIEHPTGADEVVLRYEEGGGFMMLEYTATAAPIFTLYGDGTVVFRDPAAAPPPAEGAVIRNPPFRTARLSEAQIQALLDFAATEGGLAVARERYDHSGIADAPTAVFTINAGGREKRVSVYALGIEGPDTRDEIARRGFQALADRLRQFDEGGRVPTDVYEPKAWRGMLIEAQGVAVQPRAWPWKDIKPTDFRAAGDAQGLNLPVRRFTAAELEALAVGDLRGGAHGIYIEGPDGKVYNLALRPLLPDEEA